MTTHPETAYAFPRTLSVDDMQDSLAARFGIRTVPLPTERATYYDTFDRRLGRKGGALGHRRLDGDNHLCWENGTLEIEQPTPSKKPPSFAQDLPQGPVRDVVAPLIKIRRLLPLIELERERQTLELLDDDEKIVVRLRLETSRAREPGSAQPWVDLPSVLRVRPVRGYDPERAALIAMLDAIPDLHPARGGAREVALDALGYSTPADPSELHVELSYNVRADVGLRRIHGALLDIMLANEHGLREAVDTEFLHDFRVAVRRTRALLSEVKHVFPEALVNHYKAEFAWLGGATNTTRDLDVFLLHLEDYEAELEGADLSALRKTLQKHWSRERRKLLAELDSPRFATLRDGWRAFLEDGESGVPVPRKASLPLGEVVSSRIWRVYRKTDQRAGTERDQSGAAPAEELHRIRLACKKMRYLIDCCRTIFDPDAIADIQKELRRLQNTLGDFNDAEVQAGQLSEYAAAMVDEGRTDAETLLAMGRLIERIRRSGDQARGKATRRLARFTNSANKARFRQLFRVADPKPREQPPGRPTGQAPDQPPEQAREATS